MKIYAFDIDGTICTNTYGNYELAKPYKNRIESINKLYSEGHTIKMFTARGSTTNKDWHEFTTKQITSWGLKFHELITGKPEADFFIDDKAVNHNDWEWEHEINKKYDEDDEKVRKYLTTVSESFQIITQDSKLISKITFLGKKLGKIITNGGKVIFAGNGGSFADSQHLAAEFISKLNIDRNPLPAIALGTNSSSSTAIGNDYGFEFIFSRELEAICNKKDFLIAISTSGESQNILKLLEKSKSLGISNTLLTGPNKNSKAAKLADSFINTPSICETTAEIQQIHITIGHIICDFAQQQFI